MCSLRYTIEFYLAETTRLSVPPAQAHLNDSASRTASGSFSILEDMPTGDSAHGMSDKRKKKARDARRVEARLQEMLDSNTVVGFGEPSLDSGLAVKWQKVNCDSLREAAITRAPQSLRLHAIRSGITPYGTVVKKTARIAFPIILDLSRFVARGIWEERSNVQSLLANARQGGDAPSRTLYRLESVILHYGYTHSSGHFICIRRKPMGHRPAASRKSCPDGCGCESCIYFGQVREQSVPGRGWLRVSDADVDEVGEEALIEARGAVFMLFYERVGEYEAPSIPSNASQTLQQLESEAVVTNA